MSRPYITSVWPAILIHVVGLMSFSASFSWLSYSTNPLHEGFGGPYQFLTIIALTISTLTFAVSLLADLTRYSPLFSLKAALSVCATPLEVLVTILYWGLRAIDKSLVMPPGYELPFITDFGFHAMPAIMLTLDAMLLSPPWSIKASSAMKLALVLTVLYLSWIEYCFTINNWYPYPLIALLSSTQKVYLGLSSATLMTGSTVMLKWVHGQINGTARALGHSKTA